jgi:ADP-ribose pyrophosphatase YjhB (NUDIX family)
MFTTLPIEVQEELVALAERFGQPLVHRAELAVTRMFDPFNKTDRYGEVCMVVRRPNGSLLTAKKTMYPTNAYRLLTGGIAHDEKVLDALLRETQEETGLEVVVKRFLAAVAYYLPDQQHQPVFYTFAFLLDEVGGALASLDPDEHLEYFREITPEELPERAEFFAHLAHWENREFGSDWGRFRAVIHRLVWEALNQ